MQIVRVTTDKLPIRMVNINAKNTVQNVQSAGKFELQSVKYICT